jgi:3-phenylpropionate/trans-cinnamate dioxygenase ferredoxin reductase subunit
MRPHLVIVGGGQAAVQAAQSVRQGGYDGRISLIGEEDCPPYQRPPLSKKFLAGETEKERLFLKPDDFYRTREIDVIQGCRVTAFDPGARTVRFDDGDSLDYSELLLATGGEPRSLPIPGTGLAGVHYFRSIAEVEAIREEFAPGKRLLIVGGGYIGLEVAAVATGLGLEVTVLEAGERVMARTVCHAISDFYASRHRAAGVDLKTNRALARLAGDSRVRRAETVDGERYDCDIVIIGIGIAPKTALAEAAGLAVDDGIEVDAGCRSSVSGVYAAGDCSRHPHPWVGHRIRLESVQNAIEQGKAAAASILGRDEPFAAVPWFWSDQFDLKLQIAGLSLGYDQTVTRGRPTDGSFSIFYLKEGSVIAVDSVNDPRSFILAKKHLPERPRWPAAAIADPGSDLGAL